MISITSPKGNHKESKDEDTIRQGTEYDKMAVACESLTQAIDILAKARSQVWEIVDFAPVARAVMEPIKEATLQIEEGCILLIRAIGTQVIDYIDPEERPKLIKLLRKS